MPLTDLIHYFNLRNREQYGPQLCPGNSLASISDPAGSHIVGLFATLNLDSAFQAVVDARTGLVVAHEGLLRARALDGRQWAPEAVFALPADDTEVVFLDRLCRTVHALNFLLQTNTGKEGSANGDLYLNIHARHLLHVVSAHGQVFEQILKHCGLAPQQVVFEILASTIEDNQRLGEVVSNYRQRGYRIAIDDFGREPPNFDHLWQLSPDIVKIDHALLVRAAEDIQQRLLLDKVVDIARAMGASTVAMGIETEAQLALAREAGANQLQGFLLARPQLNCLAAGTRLCLARPALDVAA